MKQGSAIVIGLALGMVFGLAVFDNIGVGIAFGMAFYLALSGESSNKSDDA